MGAFSPELQLRTLFVLDDKARITSTRELHPSPGPRFCLIRGTTGCAWAVRADLSDELAAQLGNLAREEPPTRDLQGEPWHAQQYVSLVGGSTYSGPAFTFPNAIAAPAGVVAIDDLAQLEHHFRGWTADEIPECSPIMAVIENGHAVSVCFCARRSGEAAEAGVETAPPFRGRGLGGRVTAAWALAIRASGRLPIYSTSWTNQPSLAVARKLRLEACASDWSLLD